MSGGSEVAGAFFLGGGAADFEDVSLKVHASTSFLSSLISPSTSSVNEKKPRPELHRTCVISSHFSTSSMSDISSLVKQPISTCAFVA